MQNITNTDFHTSQILLADRVRNTCNTASNLLFGGATILCFSVFPPSHLSQKVTNICTAIALFGISNRLDKLVMYASGFVYISEARSEQGYNDWLNHSMKPPARELQVNAEILKPIPTHPIPKALYGLKLECDFVQELRSPSFIRTLIKPTNCKAAQVLAVGQELQLELSLDRPPVMSISKGAIAIDTPRHDRQSAKFADYWQKSSKFEAAIGVDINNKLISVDLSQPESCHVLGAGTTGSGKSVFLQCFLLSLLLDRSPAELQLLICDAKRVSFLKFKDCANLIAPIMAEPEDAIAYLEEQVEEMEKRYKMFERSGVENIETFNNKSSEKLPRILFLFDEFGDLWDSCTKAQVEKLENLIIRLGQKARAAGIHLVVFTQRPKKVVSPRLRSNCPARVLLTVADAADSEAILGNKTFDGSQLLGRGDLFFNGDRLQALLADDADFKKLLMSNKPPENTVNVDNPNQQSALTAPAPYTSAPSAINQQSAPLSAISAQQSAPLSAPLMAIVDYAKKQNDYVSARKVQSGVVIFKSAKAPEIREYFKYLETLGYGVCRGEPDNLEFSAK